MAQLRKRFTSDQSNSDYTREELDQIKTAPADKLNSHF
jgi:hypothetical protein